MREMEVRASRPEKMFSRRDIQFRRRSGGRCSVIGVFVLKLGHDRALPSRNFSTKT